LGRAWVPAIESFTDKAYWDFYLKAPIGYVGLANGILIDSPSIQHPYWHWRMNQPIPAYLSAWAVGPFHTIDLSIGAFTVQIHALAADTGKIRGSFAHLDSAFAIFRRRYGPYRFDRLAYLLIPMAGGMEHASFIALGRNLITGDTRYEGVIVHELSHQWWGNLVTAADESEMWLNEGWATFSEWLFYQDMYGSEMMHNHTRDIFSEVVHHVDQLTQHNPVSPVPSHLTYDGMLVYDRGGMTAHNLRYYMGDSLFFGAIRQLMARAAFANISSSDLRDSFESYTGINLHPFFDDWVWKPGFPLFRIVRVDTLSPTTYRVVIEQHLRQAPTLYRDVPIEVTALLVDGTLQRRRFIVNGTRDSGIVSFDRPARLLWLWPNNELATASISRRWNIVDTGWHSWEYGYVDLRHDHPSHTVQVWVTHHWLNPDSQRTNHIQPNPHRYWTIWVDTPANGKLRFYYYGRRGERGRTARVDYPFIQKEKDLVLLYRPSPTEPWQVLTQATHHMGSPSDYNGAFETDLLSGDYALGRWVPGSKVRQWLHRSFDFFFNGKAVILPEALSTKAQVAWIDAHGRTIWQGHPTDRQIPIPSIVGPLWLQYQAAGAPPVLWGPVVRVQ